MGSSRIDAVRQRLADSSEMLPYDEMRQLETERGITNARRRSQNFNLPFELEEELTPIKRTDTRATFRSSKGNYFGSSHNESHRDLINSMPYGYGVNQKIMNVEDYTDNPRVMDVMDRSNSIRVSENRDQTSFEILNQPSSNQINEINNIFKENKRIGKNTAVTMWGFSKKPDKSLSLNTGTLSEKPKGPFFGRRLFTKENEFNEALKTNQWKNTQSKRIQKQIKPQWLSLDQIGQRNISYNEPRPRSRYRKKKGLAYDKQQRELHVNRLGRNAKSARIQMARERLAVGEPLTEEQLRESKLKQRIGVI